MQFHSLSDSFNYAFEGLIHAFRTQRNMKIHFIVAFIVLFGSLFFEIGKIQLVLLFTVISFVIAMELINTAIEVVIDMISQQYSLRAKIAKNVAAAGVFMAAINAVIVGYLIFIDDLRSLSFSLINDIQQETAHLSFISLGLLVIIIIALKAVGESGTPLQGGMPSGHSAISFLIATIIVFLTMDIVIASLVFLLALLVVQSRLQSRTHTMLEVVIGAVIGILLAIVIFKLFA
ncbi:phosphatase PAP2 family protein [Iocasia frigidifontis]|uniref:Phosphatase PAP2 family protein n=1 Tax=Iocasia fonsfrigidae TaxID=2682810 RepID=A0A8A7K928_9FIRM|nr:diacylglycerol kinase [Iocasia fonsfrigidae]QTL97971.1 phosphatase PAP2 family protein [Iocasia fonsfrigidae]